MKPWLVFLVVLAAVLTVGSVGFLLGMQNVENSIITVSRYIPGRRIHHRIEKGICQPDEISFVGYVRGYSQNTLKNKYAGFVSKVRVYSHKMVKKGDVILEYDRHTLQTAIEKTEHSIAEQQKALERKRLNLELTRLNPLPSEYRNLYWKQKIAQENRDRSEHEYNVYQRLHGSKIVTDLAFREKQEAFRNSEAEVKKIDNDMKILKKGLSAYYIKLAEIEVAEAETKLKDLQEELTLQRKEERYYKIVAPFDGYCITNSDTVGAYNDVGTAAAEVHKVTRKLLYAYCPERCIPYVREGTTYRFVSNQYPDDRQGFEAKCFEITKARYQYGDESFFLVKCRIVKEPEPLRIGSLVSLVVKTTGPEPENKPESGKKP